MPSELEDPVSLSSVSDGVDGAVVSMVTAPKLAAEEINYRFQIDLGDRTPEVRVTSEFLGMAAKVYEALRSCMEEA